jgi:hypothetical protein
MQSLIACALALLLLFSLPPATASNGPPVHQSPHVKVDVSRDQMLQRAQELVDLGIISRRCIPDRSHVPEIFSSPQVMGPTAYPFALFVTTPPTSMHPGTFEIPIEGGSTIYHFKLRLEYLEVGTMREPYLVTYIDHGNGTFSVMSADTNELDFFATAQ